MSEAKRKRGRGRPRKGLTPGRLLKLATEWAGLVWRLRERREERRRERARALRIEGFLKMHEDYRVMLRRSLSRLRSDSVNLAESAKGDAAFRRVAALGLAIEWRQIIDKYGAKESAREISVPAIRSRARSADGEDGEKDALDFDSGVDVDAESRSDLLGALEKYLRIREPLTYGRPRKGSAKDLVRSATVMRENVEILNLEQLHSLAIEPIGKRGLRKILDIERLLDGDERKQLRRLGWKLLAQWEQRARNLREASE